MVTITATNQCHSRSLSLSSARDKNPSRTVLYAILCHSILIGTTAPKRHSHVDSTGSIPVGTTLFVNAFFYSLFTFEAAPCLVLASLVLSYCWCTLLYSRVWRN